MGGKDSPPPFAQKQQQQQLAIEEVQKMAEITSLERSSSVSYCTLSLSRSTASTPSLSLRRESSPIQYVPKSKSAVNVHGNVSRSSLDTGLATLPRNYSSSGSGSPVRTYIECLSPQSLKMVVVGDSGVGKTSMLLSYTVEKFLEKHSPTIYDKFSTSLAVNGRRISLTLCDTAGSDDFGHLRPLCYPQADVAIICFSTVDHTTLDNVKTKWIKEIRRNCPGIPILLVGTKVDKREDPAAVKELKAAGKKMVSRTEAQRVASHCRASSYIECSSLSQRNIKSTFDKAIAAAMELNNKRLQIPQCAPACKIL